MSSTSPSDVDANETATAVEDGDEREDHSSSGIEMVNTMVNELMNEEDAVVDADSSERDVDDTMRANEMDKEIEMDGSKDDTNVEENAHEKEKSVRDGSSSDTADFDSFINNYLNDVISDDEEEMEENAHEKEKSVRDGSSSDTADFDSFINNYLKDTADDEVNDATAEAIALIDKSENIMQ
eukprot:674302_1